MILTAVAAFRLGLLHICGDISPKTREISDMQCRSAAPPPVERRSVSAVRESGLGIFVELGGDEDSFGMRVVEYEQCKELREEN